MSKTIINFWKEHRDFWITPLSKQKDVDEIIRQKFWYYDWASENLIGQTIYLDQFSRHFARLKLVSEFDVECNRYRATENIKNNISQLEDMDEIEIIFALMPFKHTHQYDFIFEYLHIYWLDGREIIDFPDLQRFYMDTYKKAFTDDKVRTSIDTMHSNGYYNPDKICDYYPIKYTLNSWSLDKLYDNRLIQLLDFKRKVLVSLSGGVDSMVMLSLLKFSGADVEAVHIVYGNRPESEEECNFLVEYCNRIGVKLYVYRIKWLRRGEIDREFYEDMTRLLRFSVYRACSYEEPCVLLGHIQDDIVENIWTNIAHCQHLGNLKKMEAEEVQLGVRIVRPFLGVRKHDIYGASHYAGIPYLKNTTPSWSNRGKFREYFHGATIEQFGEGIDGKMIEFAEAIQTQSEMLRKLLYEPIYASFADNKVNVTGAIAAGIDVNSWLTIFEHICHKKLCIARPSIKSVRDFHKRLVGGKWGTLNVELGKNLKIKLQKLEGEYIMEFIHS